MTFLYIIQFANQFLYTLKGNFPDWENWRKENFLCTYKMENPKIKGNFPDWENWRKDDKFMLYHERKSKNAIPRTAPAMSCLRFKKERF